MQTFEINLLSANRKESVLYSWLEVRMKTSLFDGNTSSGRKSGAGMRVELKASWERRRRPRRQSIFQKNSEAFVLRRRESWTAAFQTARRVLAERSRSGFTTRGQWLLSAAETSSSILPPPKLLLLNVNGQQSLWKESGFNVWTRKKTMKRAGPTKYLWINAEGIISDQKGGFWVKKTTSARADEEVVKLY